MISISHWGEFDLPWRAISGWLEYAKLTGQWKPSDGFEFPNAPSTKADCENILQRLNFGPELT